MAERKDEGAPKKSDKNGDQQKKVAFKPKRHLALEWCLPDAKAILSRKYKSVEQIKDTCFVALDSSVLLAPYKLDAASLTEIKTIYARLAAEKRLIIAGRALREFAKNRASKIGDLIKALNDQASRTPSPPTKLIEFLCGDDDYKTVLALSNEFKSVGDRLRKAISKVANRLGDWTKSDAVLQTYSTVFADAVVDIDLNGRWEPI